MAAGLALTHTLSAEEHREIIAMETERQLIDIEVDVLLEKFSELTRRVHQLDLADHRNLGGRFARGQVEALVTGVIFFR